MNLPFLWAHRGASFLAPENTMAAFSLAVECGADGLELDIHLSCDGVPVVIHDETLDRTTDGQGQVGNKSLRQIQLLDAGSWFSDEFAGETIPALEDVLEAFSGRVRLNLEIKEFRAGVAVLELLTHYPDTDCVVSSFDYRLLERLRAADEKLPIAVLYVSGNWRHAVRLASGLQAVAFHPEAAQVGRPMISACRQAQLPVYVWTIDHPVHARSLFRAGVAGVFTNDPLALRQIALPACSWT
jgi:glycerophosphoryl diester phosphodiesterase